MHLVRPRVREHVCPSSSRLTAFSFPDAGFVRETSEGREVMMSTNNLGRHSGHWRSFRWVFGGRCKYECVMEYSGGEVDNTEKSGASDLETTTWNSLQNTQCKNLYGLTMDR